MTMTVDNDEGNADDTNGTDRRGAQLKVKRCRDAIFKYGVSFFAKLNCRSYDWKLWL